ncbi:N-acetylmuramoyl-L-alanine amidase [Methylobacterium sp. WL120]|uniref:N-acetylmuramoyl-L-alanine amidase n=1 Tax=Methylobacterium sp. WL120 TaxID=2603887 RepID=UPI001650873C|nr:N-acetylmuramoyl-L-alanine amidase [Methylobacterium sp. WL120]
MANSERQTGNYSAIVQCEVACYTHKNFFRTLSQSRISEVIEGVFRGMLGIMSGIRPCGAAFSWVFLSVSAMACSPEAFPVAIDVGHYRDAPGATSASNVSEYVYNLALARKTLLALNSRGFSSSFLIGESGAAISLSSRPAQANKRLASAFVSIHHDSVQPRYLHRGPNARESDYASGFSIFVSRHSGQASAALGRAIGREMVDYGLSPSPHHAEPIPGENRPFLDRSIGLYAYDGLVVLRNTRIPAVLVEAAVIVNPADERRITSGDLHDKVANAIAAGVVAFCK